MFTATAKQRFYKKIRVAKVNNKLLFPKLTQSQVKGTESILDYWNNKYTHLSIRWLAYILATCYHETKARMMPTYEDGTKAYFMRNYDISGHNPALAKKLGNVKVGDGYTFRGVGQGQITGRRNMRFAGKKIGVDLESHPEYMMRVEISTKVLVEGFIGGWFTGVRLSTYTASNGSFDAYNARRIWNKTDCASLIKAEYEQFYAALIYAITDNSHQALLDIFPDENNQEQDDEIATVANEEDEPLHSWKNTINDNQDDEDAETTDQTTDEEEIIYPFTEENEKILSSPDFLKPKQDTAIKTTHSSSLTSEEEERINKALADVTDVLGPKSPLAMKTVKAGITTVISTFFTIFILPYLSRFGIELSQQEIDLMIGTIVSMGIYFVIHFRVNSTPTIAPKS